MELNNKMKMPVLGLGTWQVAVPWFLRVLQGLKGEGRGAAGEGWSNKILKKIRFWRAASLV